MLVSILRNKVQAEPTQFADTVEWTAISLQFSKSPCTLGQSYHGSLLQCAPICILMQHTTQCYVMNIHNLLAQPVLLKSVN